MADPIADAIEADLDSRTGRGDALRSRESVASILVAVVGVLVPVSSAQA